MKLTLLVFVLCCASVVLIECSPLMGFDEVDERAQSEPKNRLVRSPTNDKEDDDEEETEDGVSESHSSHHNHKVTKAPPVTPKLQSGGAPTPPIILNKFQDQNSSQSVTSTAKNPASIQSQLPILINTSPGGLIPPRSNPTSTPGNTSHHGIPPKPIPTSGNMPHGIPPRPTGPGGHLPPGVAFGPGKLPPGLPFPFPIPGLPGNKPSEPKNETAKKGELYLPDDYNNLEIPKLNLGKPLGLNFFSAVPVLVFLNIRGIRGIDELKEEVTLEMDLVVEWIDGILFDVTKLSGPGKGKHAPKQKTLSPVFLKKIWKPDIYMNDLITVTQPVLMAKPLTLKFSPESGFISYTSRVSINLDCQMFFLYYPADTQKCEYVLRSYSYYSTDLDLRWLRNGVYLEDPYDPNYDLQIGSIATSKFVQTFNQVKNETFDELKFTIHARRKLSFHLVQTYLPSIFFIIITWLCFLIPPRMVEARIGISMTTLLTLTSMFASVRSSTPVVSYVKAIDIWMVACIFFVFLTLLEFATLVWMRANREEEEAEGLIETRKERQHRNGSTKKLSASDFKMLQKSEKISEFLERFAFLIFSIIFIVFNLIYWSWLLCNSDYFNWSVNATHNAPMHDIDS